MERITLILKTIEPTDYLIPKDRCPNGVTWEPFILVGPAGVGLPISPWNRVVYRICGTISFTYAVCPRDLGFGRWETIV